MVAYNFKPQFAPLVESGAKRQTIRALGKRRHARPGDALQLYTGQRTRSCRKLIDPDPRCLSVRPIAIRIHSSGVSSVSLDGKMLSTPEVRRLAITDGFESLGAFLDFFEDRMPFDGVLIQWQPLRGAG